MDVEQTDKSKLAIQQSLDKLELLKNPYAGILWVGEKSDGYILEENKEQI